MILILDVMPEIRNVIQPMQVIWGCFISWHIYRGLVKIMFFVHESVFLKLKIIVYWTDWTRPRLTWFNWLDLSNWTRPAGPDWLDPTDWTILTGPCRLDLNDWTDWTSQTGPHRLDLANWTDWTSTTGPYRLDRQDHSDWTSPTAADWTWLAIW